MKGSSNFAIHTTSDEPRSLSHGFEIKVACCIQVAPTSALGAVNPSYQTSVMDSPWDMVLEPHRQMDIVLSIVLIALLV